MFTILNRYRGTYGWMSKVIGLVLGLLTYFLFYNGYVATLVALGYVAGECFGWGDWVGTLTSDRTTMPDVSEEGKNNGIQWIANAMVNPTKHWRRYCQVALTIRGFYWWALTLTPLMWVIEPIGVIVAILLLSFGFPLACYLGKLSSPNFSFHYKTFSVEGAWEHQEVWYGLMQDIVLVILVLNLIKG